MKTRARLKAECTSLGLIVETARGRASKEHYIDALRIFHRRRDHADEPMPPQFRPMLLANWSDLDREGARLIEHGSPGCRGLSESPPQILTEQCNRPHVPSLETLVTKPQEKIVSAIYILSAKTGVHGYEECREANFLVDNRSDMRATVFGDPPQPSEETMMVCTKIS